MFDEYFDKYALYGAGKTSRKQIKQDRAAVLERIANESGAAKRTGRRKTLKTAAVCLAASMLLGVTAYAANSDILSIIFGGGGYDKLSGLTGKMEVNGIKTYVDGLTVTPEGYASDGYNTFFVFRMDFDEPLPADVKFYENRENDHGDPLYYHSEKLWSLMPEHSLYENEWYINEGVRYDSAGEKSVYAVFFAEYLKQLNGRYENIDLTAHNMWYTEKDEIFFGYSDGDVPYIADTLFSADISVDIRPPEPVSFDASGTRFEDVVFTATPCAMRARFRRAEDDDEMLNIFLYGKNEKYLLMNDGSRVDILSFGGGEHTDKTAEMQDVALDRAFDMPIDTDNIKAFVIDGAELPIKR